MTTPVQHKALPPSPAPKERREFVVRREEHGVRLDRLLAERLKDAELSREKVKRLVLEGRAFVNGMPVSAPKTPLREGDRILFAFDRPAETLLPEAGELAILYHDAALAVLNKPAGLTVHPAPGRPTGTLAHRLLARFPELAEQAGFRPGIVHRLDKDSSGLMLVALSEPCRLALSGMFARREIFKEYLALVHGVPAADRGTIDAPVGRHPTRKTAMAVTPGGKPARSAWRLLHAYPHGRFSLLAVRIFSGRTHQVRVHMQHLGHPLVGDALYAAGRPNGAAAASTKSAAAGGASRRTAKRHMLHAWKLAFFHPQPECANRAALPPGAWRGDGKLAFICPPPADFAETAQGLFASCLRVVVTGMPGCGKSSLLNLLRSASAPVFSADAEVARQYAPGGDGHRLLRAHYGSRFVPDEKGPVDKTALGEAMRQSEPLRREVEALLHPLVWHALQTFWQEQEARDAPLAVAEIPLYLESGQGRKDAALEADGRPVLVGVHCPFAIREQRLRDKRGWSVDTITRMDAWQWPEERKMRACDLVIDNSGGLEQLEHRATALVASLHDLRNERTERLMRALARLWNGEAEAMPAPGGKCPFP